MDYEDLGNMGYVAPGPTSAGKPHTPFHFPPSMSAPYLGTQPFNSQAEVASLKHRLSVLEKRVDGLMAIIMTPKDPEGSSGAPAAPRPFKRPEEPKDDITLDTLILAQRQFHQKSPWAYDVIN